MKSIIRSKVEKKVLSVNITADKELKLMRILNDLHIEYIKCNNISGGEQLGYLLNFNGFEKSDCEPVLCTQELIVFSGVDKRELDIVLKEMRAEQIDINLKAICTQYNQRWTLSQLADELEKEHKAMTGGDSND